jgi:hypothetical protein
LVKMPCCHLWVVLCQWKPLSSCRFWFPEAEFWSSWIMDTLFFLQPFVRTRDG